MTPSQPRRPHQSANGSVQIAQFNDTQRQCRGHYRLHQINPRSKGELHSANTTAPSSHRQEPTRHVPDSSPAISRPHTPHHDSRHQPAMPLTMPPPSRMSSQGSRVPSQRQPPAYRAALHAVAIISSKPALPAELLAHVLDFLPVPALLRAARVSRRMRDMVYEDSRWVAKLRAMGAWDEAEAQRWAGQAGSARRRTTITARRETEAGGRKDNATTGDASEDAAAGTHDARSALDVLARVQSVRGLARQEFGRVYAALGPLYADMARAQGPADAAVFRAFRGPEAQARALAALARFARSDEAAGRGTRARHLAAVTADFESAVLGEFARGCADGDVDGRMRRHAHVLVLLNGGGTGVECFAASAVGALPVREARECVRGVADGHVDLGPARGFFAEVGAAQAGHAGVVARVFPAGVDALPRALAGPGGQEPRRRDDRHARRLHPARDGSSQRYSLHRPP